MTDTFNTKKRTVLIIEDDFINREILATILADKYDVIQAENGQIGLDILKDKDREISLILLDIQMPVMNGYEFLEAIKLFPSLQSIPIIVTTSSATANDEIHCLENGATDFVAKPYNPDVVLRRVASMIRLREISSVFNKVEHDPITGFFNRDFFFINAENELIGNQQTDYDIFSFDIISYRIIQDRYGKVNGEALQMKLSEALKELFGEPTVYGKIYNNIFAVLTKHKEKQEYELAADRLRNSIKESPVPDAAIHIGLYPNVSHDVSVSALCNNVHAAIEDVNYQYGRQIVEYNEAFRDKRVRRQTILGYMESALEEKQFDVFYQPKHCLETGKTGGAEALVRWNHPQLGFISPGEFIPLFENSGFITELDFYIADRVCSNLREWIDAGKNIVPISWNLSRVDFAHPHLVETIEAIVNKYSLPHELIHIELTESAYVDNVDTFLGTVKELHKAGFCIELDDFGAGYSSLTALSELNIDILKLDMYFARNMEQEKQRIILEHIFSIAHKLGMKTVAEGVETLEQSDAYRNLGCTYIQGYYYSKPLKKSDFEEYLTR